MSISNENEWFRNSKEKGTIYVAIDVWFILLETYIHTIVFVCVFISIFLFAAAVTDKKLPVLVFLHGTEFEWSSGNPYDGTVLASYGEIVVVTLNYRLGILGSFSICSLGNGCCRCQRTIFFFHFFSTQPKKKRNPMTISITIHDVCTFIFFSYRFSQCESKSTDTCPCRELWPNGSNGSTALGSTEY